MTSVSNSVSCTASDRSHTSADEPVLPEPGLPKIASRPEGPVSGAAVIIGTRILGFVSTFISIAIVARLLSPADYGLVAMVVSATAFLSIFSDLGLSYVTIQKPQITAEQLSALFWANVGFGLLLGAVTTVLAPLLVWFYGEPRLLGITLVIATTFPLTALGIQHEAILRRYMQFRRYGLLQIASTIVGAITAVSLALLGWGYWALVLQSLMIAITATTAAWLLVRWIPRRPARCKELRSMLGFGGRLTAHGMVSYLSMNLDKLLLGRFGGAMVLGLYATPYSLLHRLLMLCVYSIGQAAIPAMSRAEDSPAAMRNTYRRMLQLTCLLGLPPFLIGTLWPADLILTVLGRRWIEAAPILQLLFLAGVPRMISASTGWIYVATGQPGRMLRWELVQSPLVAIAFVVGLPWGAQGVAAGFALSSWLLFVPGFAYCLRGTALRAADVYRPIVTPLLCTAAACLAAFAGQMLLAPQLEAGAMRLIIRLALGAATYGAGALLFVPLVGEGWQKLRARQRGAAASTSQV